MTGMRSLAAFAAIVSVAYSAAAFTPEDEWHHALLKRQEPGTPAYACHEACGTAITLSRGASPCTNNEFLTDYADCLVCSGPDNFNIWRYYGATLIIAGTKCGLSTTPVSGAPASTSSSSSATATSSIPELDTESTVTPQPETTSSGTAQSTSAPASASESASIPVSTVSTTAAPTSTPASTSSVTMTAGNSTSTTVPFTGGANSANGKMAGALVVVAGFIFAAAF